MWVLQENSATILRWLFESPAPSAKDSSPPADLVPSALMLTLRARSGVDPAQLCMPVRIYKCMDIGRFIFHSNNCHSESSYLDLVVESWWMNFTCDYLLTWMNCNCNTIFYRLHVIIFVQGTQQYSVEQKGAQGCIFLIYVKHDKPDSRNIR